MPQLNIVVTEEFEEDLETLMKLRKVPSKSEAVRVAVKEAVAAAAKEKRTSFRSWIGKAIAGKKNKNQKFKSDDDLW